MKLSQIVICRFNKRVLGYAGGHGLSPFDLAIKSLEIEGRPKPDGVGKKQWIFENHVFMGGQAKKVKGSVMVVQAKKEPPPPTPKKVKPEIAYETSNAFLQSYEWRKVRMVALKKYGAVCQCCGATPQTGAVMNVDHIKPRKLFPQLALDVDNLQVLCHECNHGKGNWDMTDWRTNEVNS